MREQLADLFGVARLGQRGEAHQVREQDGHQPPLGHRGRAVRLARVAGRLRARLERCGWRAAAVPQLGQNFAPGATSAPHPGHPDASGDPHSAQNFAPGPAAVPHDAQVMPGSMPPRRDLCNPIRGFAAQSRSKRTCSETVSVAAPASIGTADSGFDCSCDRCRPGKAVEHLLRRHPADIAQRAAGEPGELLRLVPCVGEGRLARGIQGGCGSATVIETACTRLASPPAATTSASTRPGGLEVMQRQAQPDGGPVAIRTGRAVVGRHRHVRGAHVDVTRAARPGRPRHGRDGQLGGLEDGRDVWPGRLGAELRDEQVRLGLRAAGADDLDPVGPAHACRSAATDCRPSSSTERSRISTLRILPVTVIGNSSTTWT